MKKLCSTSSKLQLFVSSAIAVLLFCPFANANQLGVRSDPHSRGPLQFEVAVTPLTSDEQNELLKQRSNGGLGYSFEQFANMYVVSSMLNLGQMVGLMTQSETIEKTKLFPAFPSSYKPTFREFLDAIAVQTSSQWNYDPTNKFVKSEKKKEEPMKVALFEFKEVPREKPWELTIAKDWKQADRGGWVMFVPPQFPVGMDVYECGTYSADDATKEAELFKKLPQELALTWAKSVKPDAKIEDLKPAKVGEYDAYFFDTTVEAKGGSHVRWRNWSFISGNKGFTIISTIFPEYESQIFPDVESMLKTFKVKTTQTKASNK